jgi:hypothetical protein
MWKAISQRRSALIAAALIAVTGFAASACTVYSAHPGYGPGYRQGHGHSQTFNFRYDDRDYGRHRGGRGWR